MCSPNQEFQFVNPSSQVALYSVSTEVCVAPCKITWNTYRGSAHINTGQIEWTSFNDTDLVSGVDIFGKIKHNGSLSRYIDDFQEQIPAILRLRVNFLHAI